MTSSLDDHPILSDAIGSLPAQPASPSPPGDSSPTFRPRSSSLPSKPSDGGMVSVLITSGMEMVARSSKVAMILWRKSIDKMQRKTRFGRQISWSLVPAEDPDEALASLRDQGPPIRFVVISDTHSQHQRMNRPLPAGDILIHCGDMTNTGKAAEISSFVQWFASHPHPHKVMIAGNHDVTLDEPFYARKWSRFHSERCNHLSQEDSPDGFVPPPASARTLFYGNNLGIIALENSGTSIRGLNVWGSPFSPEFCSWSHSVERGAAAAALWQQIPSGTHVLLTHGPPVGYGDAVKERRTGDVSTRVKPLLHLFGHIHEGYGWSTDGHTLFGNASTCTEDYEPTNSPLVLDLDCSLIQN